MRDRQTDRWTSPMLKPPSALPVAGALQQVICAKQDDIIVSNQRSGVNIIRLRVIESSHSYCYAVTGWSKNDAAVSSVINM